MNNETTLLGEGFVYDLFANIWLGEWDKVQSYLKLNESTMIEAFPFLEKELNEIEVYRQNYFHIPGKFFISPYFSTYSNEKDYTKKLSLLLKMYNAWDINTSITKDVYPDHIGCIYDVLSRLTFAKINQTEEMLAEIDKIYLFIDNEFLQPLVKEIVKQKNRIDHPFFKEFLEYQEQFIMNEKVTND